MPPSTTAPNTPQRKPQAAPQQEEEGGAAARPKRARKAPSSQPLPATPPKPSAGGAGAAVGAMQGRASKRRKTSTATVGTMTEECDGYSMGAAAKAPMHRRSPGPARQQHQQQPSRGGRRPRRWIGEGEDAKAEAAAGREGSTDMEVDDPDSTSTSTSKSNAAAAADTKPTPPSFASAPPASSSSSVHDSAEPALSSERRALGLTGLLAQAAGGDLARFAAAAKRVGDDAKAWGRTDVHGRGVMHVAAARGHREILAEALASKMLPVDQEARGTGATALTYALARRDVEAAVLLLAEGADPGKIEREYGYASPISPSSASSGEPTSRRGGGGSGKGKAKATTTTSSSSNPAPMPPQTLAARLGLEQAAPRAEALALLRQALRLAVAARDEARGRPWLDAATQRQLFAAWQRGLKPGSLVDARDCDGKWYEAVVTQVVQRPPPPPAAAKATTAGAAATDGDGNTVVRVSYRCWGPKFDECIPLSSLRVLPAYAVVPRWREALAVGTHVEILSSASLAAVGGTLEQRASGAPAGAIDPNSNGRLLPERKWWDASVKCLDRRARLALLTVDGRAGCARWVGLDGAEISDIGTHMKPQQPPGQAQAQGQQQQAPTLPAPPAGVPGKTPLPPTARQAAAQAAAARGDVDALLSLISIEEPGALRLQYYRQKLGLVAAYRPDAPTNGEGCALLTARRAAGKPEVLVRERKVGVGGGGGGGGGPPSYAETRKAVLAHVVTQMNDDCFRELVSGYWGH